MKKRITAICSVLFILVTSLMNTAFAEEDADNLINELRFEISQPECGKKADEQEINIIFEVGEEMISESSIIWVTEYKESDPDSYTSFTGTFIGDEKYTALVTLKASDGNCFNDSTKIMVYDIEQSDYVSVKALKSDNSSAVLAVTTKANHDWDWSKSEYIAPTCIAPGSSKDICRYDSSHIEFYEIPIDPEAHQWGEWKNIKEPTKSEEGSKEHTCALCGKTETVTIPKVTLPYSDIYEPKTTWSMAATIAWRADKNALKTATETVRPATAFVWLDKDLKVYDRDGGVISDNLTKYIESTSGTIIPALYIIDAKTAAALKSWFPSSGLLDCFVVSTPENKALVKDVADLLHVRGMIDYTSVKSPDRKKLLEMVSVTNGAHGKVILLSYEAASRENVKLLQSLASTVWVQTPDDTKSIMTMYTNGVNGILTDDYMTAINNLERISDDAPSVLRTPLIIGHRGDPSCYVENTLDSAKGAFSEGVNSIENDIQMTTDGEIFILHDESTSRLFNFKETDENGESIPPEGFTLDELRSHTFDWKDIIENNEVSAERSRNGVLFGQEENKPYTVPTLKEYIEEFKDKSVVHDTEIKTSNPAIIPVYKELVDKYDAWDQFFTISFNKPILDAMYKDYPELSIGALGMGTWTDVQYLDYDAIANENGLPASVEALYGELDKWNATCNINIGDEWKNTILAARHRGMTVWPWTYTSDFETFAKDYMFGVNGMTTDFAWSASDLIVQIDSSDVNADSPDKIAKPIAKTQSGKIVTLNNAELKELESISSSKTIMIWRYNADMLLNGKSYGIYYLYSNPFVVSTKSSDISDTDSKDNVSSNKPATDSDSENDTSSHKNTSVTSSNKSSISSRTESNKTASINTSSKNAASNSSAAKTTVNNKTVSSAASLAASSGFKTGDNTSMAALLLLVLMLMVLSAGIMIVRSERNK